MSHTSAINAACELFQRATECAMGRTAISQHDSPLGRWTRSLLRDRMRDADSIVVA